MNYKETTKQSYQATAQAYSENVKDLAPVASIHNLLERLGPVPKILDIGCGSGRDAKIFTSLGAKVVGIDFCENLLQIAKTHAPLAEFHLMDIEAMDFPESSFDGVWAACSLLHIPKHNLPKVLSDIYNLLKPQGYFYLAVKQGDGEKLEQDHRYEGNIEKYWSYFEDDELKELIEKANFRIANFDLVETNHSYQTHSAYRLFCQKML